MTTSTAVSSEPGVPALASAMQRALELAAFGPARGVNPRVGCVILSEHGDILAEGWHRGSGTPHAEVDALAKLAPGASRGSTAVVTLEPCNHVGRTGPCALALIDAKVANVVYGVTDPGDHSCGGAERMRHAGIEVRGGLLAEAGESFLGDWLVAARLGRPFVTLKWASSLDGRVAARDGTSRWITGDQARLDVHRRRSTCDAILVGTGTVLADDPALTARDHAGALLAAQPVPVVVGRRTVPASATLHSHPQQALFSDGRDLPALLRDLHNRGLRSVFIEGGPTVASAFVAAGLVDEYLIYLAPTLIGGPRLALGDIGVTTIGQQHRLFIHSLDRLGDDVLLVARALNA